MKEAETYITKWCLSIGIAGTVGMSLSQWNELFSFLLTIISTISFFIVIIINLEAFFQKLILYYSKFKSLFNHGNNKN